MINRLKLLPFLLSLLLGLHRSAADVGTATSYSPPYLPTACYGGDASQFPSDNFFAAAGDGIWDNSAACGRLYLVKCLSSTVPRACADGQPPILVKIVDHASALVSPPSRGGATMVLSDAAFRAITNSSAGQITQINIDFTHSKKV
ncbi:unnamed protein product [Spirodela intermedia]|uniref:Expansin-like EG45 domain-containing protein n=1 Tax=Spirodela intermedia TaxID=51605 RepID=A0A7I8JNG7_SPIIN|nr:unnamed protein product [Spirodela intermedia]CAA6671727.1 unnamed protein product [Spirodela intermedia]